MGLVAKVRYTAGELYGRAKARYAASDTMRKAGQQAGQAASRVTDRVRDLSGKAAAAVKDAQARRPQHR